MGDQDWLERGHGGGESLRPMMKGSLASVADRMPIRSLLRGADSTKRKQRRRTRALVGWLLYCSTAVGGTAAAFTVRDTFFPSSDAPTKAALWVSSPKVDSTPTTEHGSTSTPLVTSELLEAEVRSTDATASSEANETQTVESLIDTSGPDSSIDKRGSTSGSPTGTTIADEPSGGPGPGTTVDDHSADASTPSSPSTPSRGVTSSAAPATTVPGGADPSDNQKGKAGGGSNGGGGGTKP